MSRARLRILRAGPLTSVQDAGRPGWRRFGVPPSGPVDRRAFAAVQAALGNPPGAAAIELSLGGVELVCEEGAACFALVGGDFAAEIDGQPLGAWTGGMLATGMRLRVREGRHGNWAYLAFAGSIDAPAWLGSRATHLLAGLGGGRLAAGDGLTIDGARDDLATGAIALPADAAPIATVRIVPGPQDRFFTPEILTRLTAEPFAASARFDRMGLVLDGPPLPPSRIDMPSEPAVRGALQVDGDGRVSLLTADHQTTGGYPRIAVVAEPDVDRVAQLRAGAAIRFAAIAPDAAVASLREAHARDAAWLAAIAAAVRSRPSLLDANLIGGIVDALRPEL